MSIINLNLSSYPAGTLRPVQALQGLSVLAGQYVAVLWIAPIQTVVAASREGISCDQNLGIFSTLINGLPI